MASAGSDFAICQRLMELATDPDNQAFILREQGCMLGLVRYLDHETPEVASMAARAIWLLSVSPSNRATLMKQPGLFDKLCKLKTSPSQAVQHNVGRALENLQTRSSSDAENTHPTAGAAAGSGTGTATGRAAATKPRAITIKVEGLATLAARDAVIKSLVAVRGVTSVTIDQRRGQAIVYTHKQEEIRPTLMEALKKAETSSAGSAREPFKALDESLDYLDEEDDTVFGEGAVAHRTGRTSLEARLAAKREKQQTHTRKRDMVKNALGRVFGSFW